jgi:DNA-binding CsgD family transcriptional regulator
MAHTVHVLTAKEKEALRLLLAGHDAKSAARQLGRSVYTVHERLRGARRKLEVSSSKEAARMLREAEGTGPESFGDKLLVGAGAGLADQQGGRPSAESSAKHRKVWAIGGFAMISLAVAALALSGAPEAAQDRAQASNRAARPAAVAESPVTQAALQWLALVDAGKWQESFAGTTQSFQTSNTPAMWQSASEGGRVPLGRVLSRSISSQESIPAPPNGYQLVRFRTDFANKASATETLSLTREGESWRIVGYYIE